MTATQPTGTKLEFGANELFFSTTDPQGRIQQANEVFVRLAKFDRDELLEAAHNIVRHPDMPGGVYRLLWDSIQAKKPFAGYIRNMSADGSHYDVFATVTALPHGGYLSVRSRPMDPARENLVWDAYQGIRAVECDAREAGSTARDCAALGARELENKIRDFGFDNYHDFQRRALIDEVTRREEELAGSLGMVITNTIDLMVRAGMSVHAEVSVLAFEQDALEELATRVAATAQRIELETPEAGSDLATDIATLHGQLRALAILSQETQFHIALARLHAAMVTQYADERFDITDIELKEESLQAIRALVDALVSGIDTMLSHVESLHSAIGAVTESIERVHEGLSDARLDDALSALRGSLRRFDDRYDERPLVAMRTQLIDAVNTAAR